MVVLKMSYGRGIEQTLAIVHRLLFETMGAILQVIHPFGHSASFCIQLPLPRDAHAISTPALPHDGATAAV